MSLLRIPANDRGHHLDDAWGRIAARARVYGSIQLHNLSKINVQPEASLDCFNVCPESICGQLNAPITTESRLQILYKAQGRFSCPFTNKKSGNEFCLSFGDSLVQDPSE